MKGLRDFLLYAIVFTERNTNTHSERSERKDLQMKFIRDKRTGDYISENGQFRIEKGVEGWNIYEWNDRLKCYHEYITTTETLKDAKESV